MSIVDPAIEKYIQDHCSEEPDALKALERETFLHVLMPRMLSGHVQGRVLSLISKMINPKQVLEIGTFTGYSAICFAEGLAQGGLVHTIDINEELEELVAKFVEKAGMQNQIKQYIGNALEIIPAIDEVFDLVFIDADKINYLPYYEMVLPKVRPGGFILADNVLWSGKVTEEAVKPKKDTQAILDFNRFVADDTRVEKVILPLRDGIFIIRKK